METNKHFVKLDWNVLEAVETICDNSKGKKLTLTKSTEVETALLRLENYFGGINETQTLIMCALVRSNFCRDEFNDIPAFFEISELKFFQHMNELEKLEDIHLIKLDELNSRRKTISLEESVINPVLHNILLDTKQKEFDSISFVTKIMNIFEESSNHDRISRALSLIEKHRNEDFIKKSKQILNDYYLCSFYYFVCSIFSDGDDCPLLHTIQMVYGFRYLSVAPEFLNCSNNLFKRDLITYTNKESPATATLTLTEKGKKLFYGKDYYLYEETFEGKNYIKPDSITKKELFYTDETQKQVDLIKNSLQNKTLDNIQKKLKEKGMPTGLCMLFYGKPGTGKTETVYQLAKETGRPIFHVEIGDTKSCWFGESEKIITSLFDTYIQKCKEIKKSRKGIIPILLFNEADAIFQNRTDNPNGSTEKTENSIQNIILEKMEKFEGILIATTNLATNFDPAFERRFLFKVKFEQPGIETKINIWKSKLNQLSIDDAAQLSKKYDFSGGEIDNIIRKATINEIVTNAPVSYVLLDRLCANEKLNTSSERRIGFEG